MPSSPSRASQRCSVAISPDLVDRQTDGGDQRRALASLRRLQQCSTAISGASCDRYHSAARTCSSGTISGSTRRSSAEQELPEQRVIPIPLPRAILGNEEDARALQFAHEPRDARVRPEGRGRAPRTCGRGRPCDAGRAGSARAERRWTRGTDSRRRTGRLRARSRPDRPCRGRSARPAGSRRPSLRCGRTTSSARSGVSSIRSWRKICRAPSASSARSSGRSRAHRPLCRRLGDVRLRDAARHDELRSRRDAGGHDRQHVVTRRRAQHMEIVEHEDERPARRAQDRCETRGRAPRARPSSARACRRRRRGPRPVACTIAEASKPEYRDRDRRRSDRTTPTRRLGPPSPPTGRAGSSFRIPPGPRQRRCFRPLSRAAVAMIGGATDHPVPGSGNRELRVEQHVVELSEVRRGDLRGVGHICILWAAR